MFRVWKVPAGVRQRVVSMRLEGAGYREIQAATGVSAGTVANVLAETRLARDTARMGVLLAEQLYRAWSMLANHPYHRA